MAEIIMDFKGSMAGLDYRVTQVFLCGSMRTDDDGKYKNKLVIKEGDQVILDTFWYGHEGEWFLKRKAAEEVQWVSENRDVLEATGEKSFTCFTCPRCRTTLKLTKADFKALRQQDTYLKLCPWCEDYIDVFPDKSYTYTSKAGNTVTVASWSPVVDNPKELERLADRTPEEKEKDDEAHKKWIKSQCSGW